MGVLESHRHLLVYFKLNFLRSKLTPAVTWNMFFFNVFYSFNPVILLNAFKSTSSVLFETNILLDKPSRVLQLHHIYLN